MLSNAVRHDTIQRSNDDGGLYDNDKSDDNHNDNNNNYNDDDDDDRLCDECAKLDLEWLDPHRHGFRSGGKLDLSKFKKDKKINGDK